MVVIVKILCDECTKEITGKVCFITQKAEKEHPKDVEFDIISDENEKMFCSRSCQALHADREARRVPIKPHYSKKYAEEKGLGIVFLNDEIGLVKDDDCTIEKGVKVVKPDIFWAAKGVFTSDISVKKKNIR